MPKLSKTSVPLKDFGPVAEHAGDLDGYTVGFTLFRHDLDHSPLLKGCKDDRCQCPHWGYVLRGKMTFRYPDRDETYDAGDAFYAPPGHVPINNTPETELLMFSPTVELKKTEEVIMKNLAAMQGK
ncbi:MAG: hypothetical protein AB7P03_17590 [Kofleriaceae bacterium]